MNISENGKRLIKKYEGCRLTAYKPVAAEKYWTIGWGHYGPDISKGQTITQAQADAMFDRDIVSYVNHVRALNMSLNQNQFDALVSFCYNCGAGNLQRLCSDRSIASISRWITAYNKGSGMVLAGLTRRRAEEKALFDKPVGTTQVSKPNKPAKPAPSKPAGTTQYRVTAGALNMRNKPSNSGKVVGVLKKGQTVQVVSIDKDGWAKLKSNNTHVYAYSTYLKKA